MAYRTRLPRRGKTYGKASLLYQVWINLKGRVTGHSTRTPEKYKGLPLGFKDFSSFRAFALKTGFCKATPSPDRVEELKGYVDGNIKWTTVEDNTQRHLYKHWYSGSGAQPEGPEPPFEEVDDVPF